MSISNRTSNTYSIRTISRSVNPSLMDLPSILSMLSTQQIGCVFQSSLDEGEKSFVCINSLLTYKIKINGLLLTQGDDELLINGNPLDILKAEAAAFRLVGDRPKEKFVSGLIGLLGYDAVLHIEKIKGINRSTDNVQGVFTLFGTVVVIDHLTGAATICVNRVMEFKESRPVDEELSLIEGLLVGTPESGVCVEEKKTSSDVPSIDLDDNYLNKSIEKIKSHISSGEVFQCVLSEGVKLDRKLDPMGVFLTMRRNCPSQYHYVFFTGTSVVVTASPEAFVTVNAKRVRTFPLAGTSRRGDTTEEDAEIERRLLSDPKENAEHAMLVDLGRNDIGRVCLPGTVKIRKHKSVIKFTNVMHLESEVEGYLKDGKDAFDALYACFPAGTLTGAPKIRAMQLIAEMEKRSRGYYGGAFVLYDFCGDMDSCINIRSVTLTENEAEIRAGAGIVHDSIPESEIDEIKNKALPAYNAVRSNEMRELGGVL